MKILINKMSVIMLLCLTIALTACRTEAPALPSATTVTWVAYANTTMGVHLEHPDSFTMKDRDEMDVIFQINGKKAARLVFADETYVRSHGLWLVSEPAGEATLAGQTAQKYVYDHYDGPSYDHMVAYVILHRGKLLGLEFHTDQDELNEVQQRILDSVQVQP